MEIFTGARRREVWRVSGGTSFTGVRNSMGASRVDVGQGGQPWVVLADPEGNEFCVLGRRADRG